MTTSAPGPTAAAGPSAPRRRDAASTRHLLLDAAWRRFARDGYAATTVRDIADEAGVNVALINRYFTSKEGLFKACLTDAVDEFGRAVSANVTLDRVPHVIAGQLAGPRTGKHPSQLVLLLRSSGDERADQIRLGILRSFAERLAATAGREPDDPDGDRLLLRAQLALAAALGIALLRSTAPIEPLASASEDDLIAPLHDLISGLLTQK
jgi:AcrR family transcriptional regulator